MSGRPLIVLSCPAGDAALSGWQTRPGHGSVSGMTTSPNPYRGFRFPAEIIEHAVWLYHCFSLSLRDVETVARQPGWPVVSPHPKMLPRRRVRNPTHSSR